MKNGFGLIGILIVIAVIALAGGGGLYWSETKKQQSLLETGVDAVKRAEELKKQIESREESIYGGRTSINVDTSDWKTYRNEKYGFEVKYPDGLSTELRPYDNYGFQLLFNSSTKKSIIAVELVNARSTSFLNFVENQKESVKQGKIVVDGITADFYEGLREFTVYNAVALLRGNDLIIIYQYSVDRSLFDQILSTFKFIKPVSQAPIATKPCETNADCGSGESCRSLAPIVPVVPEYKKNFVCYPDNSPLPLPQ